MNAKVTDGEVDKSVYKTYDKDNPAYQSSGSLSSKTSKKLKKKGKKETKVKSVGIGKLFSYSTPCDRVMIIFALLMSIGMGVAWPLIILVFGQTTDVMASYQYYLIDLIRQLRLRNINVSNDAPLSEVVAKMKLSNPTFQLDPTYDIFEMMKRMSQNFAGIALGMLVMSYVSVTFFVITSQRQVAAMRLALFRSILRQNIGWFDEQNSGAINNKLIDDINTVHSGIGDKVGQMVQWFSCTIAGIILAFVSGWQLTLVTLSISPVIVITMLLLSKTMMKLNQKVFEEYGKAGGIAEEVLGSIRTITSFKGEMFESSRYTANLDNACVTGIKKSIITGTLLGLVQGLMFGSYSLGFWYGSKLIRDGIMKVGQMLIIFFSCLMATMGLGQATPYLGAVNEARNAAGGIFEIIDRVPTIDKMDPSGKKLENFKGKITFKNVNFTYPTRLDCQILKSISLNINSGQTVALVGSSGCGKSSIIQLIQRFYDICDGELLIDDVDVRQINIKWLREQIGVVSQEPVLFGTNIRENIRYGRIDVTDAEIDEAIQMANAKGFIEALPNGLDTLVGDRGTQLSGGQKQRIAIARALIRNPKILLLDEATSALDTHSEKIVQEALDKVSKGRTTIIIAHRLSTVRNADVIFGIKDGCVLESGNHNELIAINGLYKDLVERQKIDLGEESNVNEDNDNEIYDTVIYENIEASPKKSVSTQRHSVYESVAEVLEGTKNKKNHFFRVLNLNGPEKWYILLGCIGALLNGSAQPAFSVVFGYIIPAMANPNVEKQNADITMYVLSMAAIAVVVFVANVIQNVGFGNSGEQLTKRCRSLTFKAMLRQNIGWFDMPENNIGALTTRLSHEASAIRGLSGECLGSFFQAVCAMGAAVVIAFIYCWQISLVVLAFVPIIFVGGVLQIRVMSGFSNSDKGALEESGKIAVECIENIRTVSNLTREETFIEHYQIAVKKLTGDISKKAHIQGFSYGITQAAVFCAYAATFVLAGYLLNNNMVQMTNVYISFGALIFGAMNLGKAMAMTPDYGKGKIAAGHMFDLLDRVPPIDSDSQEGICLNTKVDQCYIETENVHFRYPLRPKIKVMNGISLDIEPNKTVALVGPSGCGKSTIIQLLQRFYDPTSGNINIDKNRIPDINIKNLREIFSIVSQEPTLFSYSIQENIAYADTKGSYSNEQIVEVAKASNIHDFIINLPDKYETKVGEKGSNFSGGQKQRIAIARALLRNPKILLLDEATSALDTESEKIVEDALDKAQQGRTCLVIAHRLSTIQNADKIIVFKEGKIAEIGTHLELIKKNGIYSGMIKLQTQK